MRITSSMKTLVMTMAAALILSSCGAWQTAKDATLDVTRAVFVAKVKQMNVVFTSRSALNAGDSSKALPVVLRVYQLKDTKAFETATYAQLIHGDHERLKVDLLWSVETTLAPDTTLRLTAPMNAATRYVGVVAFFRDMKHGEWQLVIPKSQWRKTDPVKLAVADNRVELETEN